MSWTQFERVSVSRKFAKKVGTKVAFENDLYYVLVYPYPTPPSWPDTIYLSIRRQDREAVHDWRDFQRIKNEICGTECEGCELYPAESRLWDEANQYHLFVFAPGSFFPLGFKTRYVSGESGDSGPDSHVQRPFDDHHTADGCEEDGLLDWSEYTTGDAGSTET